MLPYPSRYESHRSWSSRCDEYEANQARWRREQAARNTNWGGSNYRAVIKKPHVYTLQDGREINCERVYPGSTKKQMALTFAWSKGLVVIKNQIGAVNMITSRPDWVVVTAQDAASLGLSPVMADGWDFSARIAEEKYSNDDH